jgi:hypothetical protein
MDATRRLTVLGNLVAAAYLVSSHFSFVSSHLPTWLGLAISPQGQVAEHHLPFHHIHLFLFSLISAHVFHLQPTKFVTPMLASPASSPASLLVSAPAWASFVLSPPQSTSPSTSSSQAASYALPSSSELHPYSSSLELHSHSPSLWPNVLCCVNTQPASKLSTLSTTSMAVRWTRWSFSSSFLIHVFLLAWDHAHVHCSMDQNSLTSSLTLFSTNISI